MLYFYKMPPFFKNFIDTTSNVLTLIYNLEALIKILALQKEYFHYSWNCLDFFICLTSDLGLFLNLYTVEGVYNRLKIITQVLMAFRILRVFRLIRMSQNLRKLMDSLVTILPSIFNVSSLILLMLFVFSVIGMNMFSNVIHQKELNENFNFSNFGLAFVTLIRCATGEKWNEIMRELAVT